MMESVTASSDKYWSYIIVYVDDILCIHHDPHIPMNQISDIYRMKDGSISKTKIYLQTLRNGPYKMKKGNAQNFGRKARKAIQKRRFVLSSH